MDTKQAARLLNALWRISIMKKSNKQKTAHMARKRAAHNLKRKGVTYDAKKAQQRLAAVSGSQSITL